MRKSPTPARGKPTRPAADTGVPPDRSVRKLTDVFKSLGDESRLRILFMLARHGEMNVTAIGEELGQSQPAVSHHLTQLRAAGLIDYRRDGKFNFYALYPDGFHEVMNHLFPDGPGKIALGGVEVTFRRK